MENKNELVLVEVPKANLTAKRNNYELTIGAYNTALIRDVDFGKVPKAKKPSLWKAGAEKVLLGFGLYYDTIMTDSFKDHENGYFYYEFTARAYDQQGRVVRAGVGCANTRESGTGMATGFNTCNSAIKKARKRAIVDLALTIANLSDAFTQDIEDETNEQRASQLQKDDDFINTKQIQRIFAIATSNGMTVEKAKQVLKSMGYESTKSIKVKDYDKICEEIEKYAKENK